MAITLTPTTLHSTVGDHEGRLAMRDGSLFAVLSCLGELHGELLGVWFVEATFGDPPIAVGQTYATLDQFERHAAERVRA